MPVIEADRVELAPAPPLERLRSLAPFLPAAFVVGTWIVWAQASGGYFARDWYPGVIAAAGLAGVVAIAGGRALPPSREVRVLLALLAAFVGWSFLSLLWSESPGSTLEAANKLLLYLAMAWTLALLPWTARSTLVLLGAWALGLAAVCTSSLVGAVRAEELGNYLFEFRFQDPVGYPNGNAALALVGAFAALALTHARELPTWLKALFLAVAAFLVQFSLLAQSRGSLIGLAAGLIVLVALSPERLRLLARLAMVAGVVAFSVIPIFEVYDAGEAGRRIAPVLDEAALRIALSTVLAAVGGLALGLLEQVLQHRQRAAAAVRQASIAALVILGLVALVAALATSGRIIDTLDEELRSATSGGSRVQVESTHLSSRDLYQRPDYWRVAIDLFEESPLLGAGAGNFEREYTVRRREEKHARYVHNLFLRALAEGGVVGGLLVVGFFLFAIGAAVAVRRRLAPGSAVVVAASLAVTVYFAVHANSDWLDEIPAVAAPALGLPFVALAVAFPGAGTSATARVWSRVAAPLVVVAALVSLVPAYLAVRYVERAFDRFQGDPSAAFEDLDRARDLNPTSVTPLLSEGTLALRIGHSQRARRAFERSLEREPNWYAHFELALLDASVGRFAAAERRLRRAAALNARDPLIARIRKRVAAREPIDPARINRSIGRATRRSFTDRQR
jgi:tetratricopeptide (TPR) repeat protein